MNLPQLPRIAPLPPRGTRRSRRSVTHLARHVRVRDIQTQMTSARWGGKPLTLCETDPPGGHTANSVARVAETCLHVKTLTLAFVAPPRSTGNDTTTGIRKTLHTALTTRMVMFQARTERRVVRLHPPGRSLISPTHSRSSKERRVYRGSLPRRLRRFSRRSRRQELE